LFLNLKDTATLSCLWNRLASRSYIYFFIFTAIFTPFCLIIYFYIKIYLKVRKQTSTNQSSNSNNPLRITKGLFASCVIFVICNLPYGIVIVLDFREQLPRTAYMFTLLMLHLNSFFNPFLYALTNTPMLEGYKNFFFYLFQRKKYNFSQV